tara:strand:- start:285 stop:620 length:336 start_codon:yes stop_codon:yes gene_type:complete
MSEFFESEIVRQELEEINELQKSIYGSLFSFATMDREDKLEHVEMLIELLKKQRIMYTRLSLSDDPEAIKMKEDLKRSIEVMGFPEGTDIQVIFETMDKTIETLKQQVDLI